MPLEESSFSDEYQTYEEGEEQGENEDPQEEWNEEEQKTDCERERQPHTIF